mgnify:CR=1 FL=1
MINLNLLAGDGLNAASSGQSPHAPSGNASSPAPPHPTTRQVDHLGDPPKTTHPSALHAVPRWVDHRGDPPNTFCPSAPQIW